MAPSSGLFLATIYNQSQLAERKHVARNWSISAVPVSAHPSPLVITTKLAAAILVVVVVRRRGSAGPVGVPTLSADKSCHTFGWCRPTMTEGRPPDSMPATLCPPLQVCTTVCHCGSVDTILQLVWVSHHCRWDTLVDTPRAGSGRPARDYIPRMTEMDLSSLQLRRVCHGRRWRDEISRFLLP